MARALSLTLSLNPGDVEALDARRKALESEHHDQWDAMGYARRVAARTRSAAGLFFLRLGLRPAAPAPANMPAAGKPASSSRARPRGRKPAAGKARRRRGGK